MRHVISFLFLLFPLFLLTTQTENSYKVLFSESTPQYISVIAKYQGALKYYKKESNPHFQILNITVFFQSPTEFRVLITDRFHKRWQIPDEDPYPHDQSFCLGDKAVLFYKVEVNKNPFSFKVIRTSTQEVLFNTEDFNFIMSDRYLEFSSILPSENLFGIGERVADFKLRFPGVYTIWARDLPGVIDNLVGGDSTYGLFPLYLIRESQGYFHLVYLRNSNGMDILLEHKNGIPYITYKVVGGVVDLKFFFSENKSAEEPVRAYHKYIGGYMLQPFWSFGFHQCRWGYTTWSKLNSVLSKYHDYGMPLDAIWMDIDYMDGYRDFTIDDSRYNVNDMNDKIENYYKKKLVLILDPGVKIDPNDNAYKQGIEKGIFLKGANGKPLTASVWPGDVHFVDFFMPKAQDYWGDMLEVLHKKIKYSGIWLDMNEFSNFQDGSVCTEGDCGPTWRKCQYPDSDYYYIYNPGGKPLDNKAVCLNAKHYDGNIEYDLHNFNGYMETISTYKYLKERLNQPQPFILTRSSVPGTGKYSIHWTGDNVSTYQWLRLSIAGLINFNIFGIPNVGADICGFDHNTDEDMCIRWMQVGTLYPFSRNHNHLNSIAQDPFAFTSRLTESCMTTLKFRYSILKYFYYLFIRNRRAGTVMRPLFFEFPDDLDCYSSNVLEEQFLLGDGLLVTPVVVGGLTEIEPFFPGDTTKWYRLQDGNCYEGGSKHKVVSMLNETAPIFLRSGMSFYKQEVTNVTRSDDLDNNITFVVAFGSSNNEVHSAKGQYMGCSDYGDYSKLEKCIDTDCLVNVAFEAAKKEDLIRLNIGFSLNNNSSSGVEEVYLAGLELLGADFIAKEYSKIEVKNLNGDFILRSENQGEIKFSVNENIKVLKFGRSLAMKNADDIVIEFS